MLPYVDIQVLKSLVFLLVKLIINASSKLEHCLFVDFVVVVRYNLIEE